MDKTAALNTIDLFRENLKKLGIHESKIILYGSFSRGNYHEGSDIDLVVISKDFKKKGYWKRIEILANAITPIFAPIEAVAMTPEEWESGNSLIVEFARTGEIV
jgi:predicted nucleotidyltransferase